MIRADQIPPEVVEALAMAWRDEMNSAHAIAAALAAWPGMLGHGDLAPSENGPPLHIEQAIILPLPQEDRDDA